MYSVGWYNLVVEFQVCERFLTKGKCFVAFVAFFHVASLFSTGIDIEKALELGNRIFFFIFQPDFKIEISPENATKHTVA